MSDKNYNNTNKKQNKSGQNYNLEDDPCISLSRDQIIELNISCLL